MKKNKENRLTHWMAENGINILRVSIGITFLWFGFIKYFPGFSPIEDLALRTINVLTFNFFTENTMAKGLASLECVIGLGLISGKFLRLTLILLIVQLIGAVSPLFIFTSDVFKVIPIVPTLDGQYIIKDIIIISAAILIGSSVRGGKMIADPQVANAARKLEEEKLKIENREV